MAKRPVFIPLKDGPQLVEERPVEFRWHPGMSASQKKKNVHELHWAANKLGFANVLEVSSKSDSEAGRRLSAFYQKIEIWGKITSVESAYQASKKFEYGGPYVDLLFEDPRTAKRDERLKNSGRVIGFCLMGRDYPIVPQTAFYDWLYCQALGKFDKWVVEKLSKIDAFTDIEFNPERQVNCQARSCAIIVALAERGILARACADFDTFVEIVYEHQAVDAQPDLTFSSRWDH